MTDGVLISLIAAGNGIVIALLKRQDKKSAKRDDKLKLIAGQTGEVKAMVNGAREADRLRIQELTDLLAEIHPDAVDAGKKRIAARKPGYE